ncbi:MAG: hypothetical protein JO048_03675 [Methylobacteriaceae bacterium]|nr:hypothetical protein [Methylobacteriaceae bacterium]
MPDQIVPALDLARPGDVLVVDAGRKTLPELVRLAAEASRAGQPVRLTGVADRSLEELVRVVAVGGDVVSFAPTPPRDPPARPRPRRTWFALRRR